ncbi:aliphatic sulfonate ABC transporter permease SsuC [Peribacillus muralis]|uniref:aliphatic sulfonate ABC transporter permease SsuC n=1 Tax=Peribacillus muralis TaxID=264697 RepID=UPI001F4E210B|nr:aliphatic sulfonate ABC transporter permease SsuC [Peribacillus muralis]MCK1995410.1 aliphatic sulfonate ABC transporter permease SsuC [Peribacillus muralis]MCK2015993.1 aliphatic sulfonate ABC transporter permease SsuC [Peribacillus muralis]
MQEKLNKKLNNSHFISWIVPLILLVTWQMLSLWGVLSERILPAPTEVLQAGAALLETGDLAEYIGISAKRAFIGFLIGGIIGFVLGLLNGISNIAETLFDTSLQMLRNIPHLALIPLVILWFGIEEEAKIFLVALGVLFPIYLNTFHGVKSVDKDLIEAARVYGLHGFSLFWNVILPAALPSILVGIRFSLGIMWVTLIVAETISANSGIGYMAMNAREFMRMDVVVLSILLYALLGKISDVFAKIVEKRCLKWHPSYQ